MSRLNLHVGECISEDGRSYYIELVLHDHADEVDGLIADYERELSKAGLLNVPFHMVDLLHAHGDYKGLEVKERKLLLSRFSALFRVLPVKCAVFDVLNGRHAEPDSLEHLIAKELGSFVVDNLAFFQRFDEVHVYYDGGKAEVKSAIQKALGEALAKGTVRFKGAVYRSSGCARWPITHAIWIMSTDNTRVQRLLRRTTASSEDGATSRRATTPD